MSRYSLEGPAMLAYSIKEAHYFISYITYPMNFIFCPYFSTIINNVILFSHNLHSIDSNNLQDYKFKHNLIQSTPNLYGGVYTSVHFEHKEKKSNAWHLVGKCFVVQESFAFVLRKNLTIKSFLCPQKRGHSNPPCSMKQCK